MNSSEFDQRFDADDSVVDVLDLNAARRPRQEQKRVNVDFPVWMVEQLDREASRLGVTRQSIIKVWLLNGWSDDPMLRILFSWTEITQS